MAQIKYPKQVSLVDADHKSKSMPSSLNLIGEAEVVNQYDKKEEKTFIILTEDHQWFEIDFIMNNYQ